jgi:hypothetical protein
VSEEGTIHFALGGVDLDGHVVMPVSLSGLARKTSVRTIPGVARSILTDQGVGSLQYAFDVLFDDLAEGDAFEAIANTLAEDLTFFAGSQYWYHDVKYMSIMPKEVIDFNFAKLLSVDLYLEDPYLYYVTATRDLQVNHPLPYTSSEFENTGSGSTPFESIKIIGRYLVDRLKSATVSLMNGSDLIDSVLLSDELLSDEEIDFQDGNVLVCTYEDDFPDLVREAIDKYASSGTVTQSGSSMNIAASSSVTYKLFGPNPTADPVNLTLDAIKTGSPIVEISTNGTTWYTSLTASDILSGLHSYDLPDTEHCTIVYVRFTCPAGATLAIDYLKFIARRSVLGDDFVIPPGEVYSVLVEDAAASSSHLADIGIVYRNRKWP